MNDWKHPNDMTREELRGLIGDMAWLGLDLAQHLSLTERGLEPEEQPSARQQAIDMAYGLAWYPYDGPNDQASGGRGQVNVAMFGDAGLERRPLAYDDPAGASDHRPAGEVCDTCHGDGTVWGPIWSGWENRCYAAQQAWLREHPDEDWYTSQERRALLDEQPSRDEKYLTACDDCAGPGILATEPDVAFDGKAAAETRMAAGADLEPALHELLRQVGADEGRFMTVQGKLDADRRHHLRLGSAEAMASMSEALHAALEGDHQAAAEHYDRARQASVGGGNGCSAEAIENDIRALLDRTPRDSAIAEGGAARASASDPGPDRVYATEDGKLINAEGGPVVILPEADLVAECEVQRAEAAARIGDASPADEAAASTDDDAAVAADPKADERERQDPESTPVYDTEPGDDLDVDSEPVQGGHNPTTDQPPGSVEQAERAVLELRARRMLEDQHARARDDQVTARQANDTAKADGRCRAEQPPVLSAFDD